MESTFSQGEGLEKMTIGDTEVSVEWEENGFVEAPMELAGNELLAIQMPMYGSVV